MKKYTLFMSLLIACLTPAGAAVRYVNLFAAGTQDGTSWVNAFTGFQAAIDASVNGDSIFVATATYLPASGTSFSMKEGVKIFGGFAGTEDSFSQRNLGNKATLKGNGTSVILNDNNGLTAAGELDGFIITGGNSIRGGGMYNNNNVSPTIRNCIFKNNSASGSGNGGGMYNRQNANPLLINCLFSGNASVGNGGGMVNVSSNPSIINCVFWANASGSSGGGIYNLLANPIITNTIIWLNTSVISNRNGLYVGSGASPVVSFCNIQDAVVSGVGNISTDPLFIDAPGGDFTLQSTSLCINTGLSAANTTSVDLIGNVRIVGTAIDMGAFEQQGTTVPVALVQFVGSLRNGMASLQWESAVESNLNSYVIEKSEDGDSFLAVGTAIPKGNNSSYTYMLSQKAPIAYYRLQIVNNGIKSTYSDIIRLSQVGKGLLSLYPNPAKNYIQLNATKAGKVYIYNAFGALVQVTSVLSGQNKIGIQHLSAGVYFLKLDGAEINFIKR